MTDRQANKSLYWAWKAMKQRCQNPRCKAYHNYGARGIKVCEKWKQFEPFLAWALNNGYEKGLDLDRKDNDGDYEPSNCRWISRRDNINNRRNTIMIEVEGETLPDTVWAEKTGIERSVLKGWLKKHGTEYTSSRIKNALVNGYTHNDYGYSHRKAIRHVESGKVYRSVKDAAAAHGIGKSTISNAICLKGGVTSAGRFEWEEQK